MRFLTHAAVIVAILGLTGCNKVETVENESAAPTTEHGRYIGIGVFGAGELWQQQRIDELDNGTDGNPIPPQDKAAATTADDEHIIVVVDSATGEVRECGDYSGRCVSMNPWTKAIAKEQRVPVMLVKHAADLAAEREAAAQEAEQMARKHMR
jgi:hypothetical protein